mgnify:FL=1
MRGRLGQLPVLQVHAPQTAVLGEVMGQRPQVAQAERAPAEMVAPAQRLVAAAEALAGILTPEALAGRWVLMVVPVPVEVAAVEQDA